MDSYSLKAWYNFYHGLESITFDGDLNDIPEIDIFRSNPFVYLGLSKDFSVSDASNAIIDEKYVDIDYAINCRTIALNSSERLSSEVRSFIDFGVPSNTISANESVKSGKWSVLAKTNTLSSLNYEFYKFLLMIGSSNIERKEIFNSISSIISSISELDRDSVLKNINELRKNDHVPELCGKDKLDDEINSWVKEIEQIVVSLVCSTPFVTLLEIYDIILVESSDSFRQSSICKQIQSHVDALFSKLYPEIIESIQNASKSLSTLANIKKKDYQNYYRLLRLVFEEASICEQLTESDYEVLYNSIRSVIVNFCNKLHFLSSAMELLTLMEDHFVIHDEEIAYDKEQLAKIKNSPQMFFSDGQIRSIPDDSSTSAITISFPSVDLQTANKKINNSLYEVKEPLRANGVLDFLKYKEEELERRHQEELRLAEEAEKKRQAEEAARKAEEERLAEEARKKEEEERKDLERRKRNALFVKSAYIFGLIGLVSYVINLFVSKGVL
ncbi:MAG: hypothetical protein IJ831_05610 [Spirochaetales bacterium]|nr:hypothetical protein [Spirochaetales bacterium]